MAAYKAAADLAPDVAANPANCAAAALMLRQFKPAAEYAVRAAALQPSFVRAHIRAGKACLCMGRFDQAGLFLLVAHAALISPLECPIEERAKQGLCHHKTAAESGARAAVKPFPLKVSAPARPASAQQTVSRQGRSGSISSVLYLQTLDVRMHVVLKPVIWQSCVHAVTLRKHAWLQAAAHYQRALQIDSANAAARSEALLVEHARSNIEAGMAVLDTDARQAQWYADVAGRNIMPVLEPAAMLRCKASRHWIEDEEYLSLTTKKSSLDDPCPCAMALHISREVRHAQSAVE